MHDLVLTGGRVLDPAAGRDEIADVAFANGVVAAVGRDLGDANEVRDVSGRMVVPELIDLHTQVYWGGTSLGVEADEYAKPLHFRLCGAGFAGQPGTRAVPRASVAMAKVKGADRCRTCRRSHRR
jgi:dihydroorotase